MVGFGLTEMCLA